MSGPDIPITYDPQGRMNYHPDFHPNQGKPWTTSDERYLIENYEKFGPEQVSLELGRTIHTVMTRAYELRKKGRMAKPAIKRCHKREMKPQGGKPCQSK